MKVPYNERLLKFTKADEAILAAKLEAVRSAIDHPAEKGRAVEENVRHFIRDLLPSEYGVSTGFIAYHENTCQKEMLLRRDDSCEIYEYTYSVADDRISISRQLDVIIYDALRFGPIARLGTCDVFPAEAVLAYIEVKSVIDGSIGKSGRTDLQEMLLQSQLVRDIHIRQYHVPIPTTYIHTMLVMTPIREVIDIRAYGFILEGRGKYSTAKSLCEQLLEQNKGINGFFSGLYLYGVGFVASHHSNSAADPDNGKFEILDEKDPLVAFKNGLLTSLCRFPRPEKNWAPAIDRYYSLSPALVPKTTLEINFATKEKRVIFDINNLSVIQTEP
jgi:hypothetical protein